jgi:hypothetical protein
VKLRRRPHRETSDSMQEIIATIAIQRRLRKALDELEVWDPQSSLLSEYPKLNARALRELRKIRERIALVLRRVNVTAVERKIATEHLHLISLVESEFIACASKAH